MVNNCLKELLIQMGMGDKEVQISKIENANLIGAAMSVLS
jgi:hypothetical protein